MFNSRLRFNANDESQEWITNLMLFIKVADAARRIALPQLMEKMFSSVTKSVQGELQAACNDYELLAKMNTVADMEVMVSKLNAYTKRLEQRFELLLKPPAQI
ncbi:hypothetical protein CYMTET_51030 [Cymbomonas tetramitiformis]|uniref:Uncharacterized protein n=1 Tax=Cymbomonas tetramitiformis TaxID=36881 RepID=A0AAE0BM36_9CHLO|nr:hypothetical protein CYMTET_51030 [Cymbomonas tetramitiformis]